MASESARNGKIVIQIEKKTLYEFYNRFVVSFDEISIRWTFAHLFPFIIRHDDAEFGKDQPQREHVHFGGALQPATLKL